MLGVRLFPPQVLSDLNFFNVKDESELRLRLRTVQRVAVASLGVYLLVGYGPGLLNQLSFTLRNAVILGIYMSSACLSAPMTLLFMAAVNCYAAPVHMLRNYGDKQIGGVVVRVGILFCSYLLSQLYRSPDYNKGPNFLEKLFQKIEDKVIPPLWDAFYKNQSSLP